MLKLHLPFLHKGLNIFFVINAYGFIRYSLPYYSEEDANNAMINYNENGIKCLYKIRAVIK